MFREIEAEALFASHLGPSDDPDPEQVRAAIASTLQALGPTGCLGAMAQSFGEYPESAAARMRWALSLLRVA